MPIDVFIVEDLFWAQSDNDWYKVPNSLPSFIKERTLEQTPVIVDEFCGYIDLIDEGWNYCKYKNTYYILRKREILCAVTKRFRYVLSKDIWINWLLKNPITVRGTVGTWNDDELLREHLNKCEAYLDNPSRVEYLNFEEKEFVWTDFVEVLPINKEFSQVVLSQETLDWFKSRTSLKARFDIAKKYWFDPKYSFAILAQLKASHTTKGWKKKVADLINESLKDFRNEERIKERVITKVTAFGESSFLKNKFAISYKTKGIGTTVEEGWEVPLIDLETITDIVPLNNVTGKKLEVTKNNNYWENLHNISDDIGGGTLDNCVWQLQRRLYLPKSVYKETLNETSYQEIIATNGVSGYLLWVDRLDFILGSKKAVKDKAYSHDLFYPYVIDNTLTLCRGEGFEETKGYPHFFLEQHLGDMCPSYGFLIYQTIRSYNSWKQFEYIGSSSFKSINYYSGLNNNFINNYYSGNEWYHAAAADVVGVTGNDTLDALILDLDNFAFLTFKQKSLRYWHEWFDWDQTASIRKYINPDNQTYWNYASTAILSTIHYKRKQVRKSPYYKDKYPAFAIERENKLNNITTKKTIDFEHEIKQGDYLISDLEYQLVCFKWKDNWYSSEQEYKSVKKQKDPFSYSVGGGTYGTTATGDCEYYSYFENYKKLGNLAGYWTNYSSKIFDRTYEHNPFDTDNVIVLCSNRSGGIELRILRNEKFLHQLEESGNVIQKVNDSKQQEIGYHHLSKSQLIEEAPLLADPFDSSGSFKSNVISDLVYLFYKFQDEPQINLEYLSNNIGQLFDLVGTKWYAYIREDKVHLIAKDSSALEKTEKIKVQKLSEHKDLKALTVTELVNQKCFLSVYSSPFWLKSKFYFTDTDENFKLQVYNVSPADAVSPLNHFMVRARHSFDTIEELVIVGKEGNETLDVTNSINLQRAELELQRAKTDYDLAYERSDVFARRKIQTAYDRSLFDLNLLEKKLDITESRKDWDFGIGFVANVASLGATGLMTGAKLAAGSGIGYNTVSSGSRQLGGFAKGISRFIHDKQMLGVQREQLAENRKRAAVDYALNAQAITYGSMQLGLTHLVRKQNVLLNLNSISNNYFKPQSNDMMISKEINKINNLKPINLRIFLPTPQQLKYLEEMREEFGIDCFIPNVQLTIEIGMKPNVVRFINLDDTGIIGIENKIERDLLKDRLHAGIKIVDIHRAEEAHTIPILYMSKDDCKKEITRLEEELSKKSADLSSAQEQASTLTKRVEDKDVEIRDTQKKLQDEKAKTYARDLQIKYYEDIEKKHRTATEDLDKANKDLKDERDKLKRADELLRTTAQAAKDKDQEIETLTKERDDEKQKVIDLTKKKEELEGELVTALFNSSQIKEKDNTIKDLTKQIEKAQKDIEQLTKKKEELAGKLVEEEYQAGQAHEQIDKANAKIKELKTKIGELEDDIDDKAGTIAVYESTTDKTKQELTTKIAELNKHVAELEGCKKTNKEAETNIKELKGQIENLNSRLKIASENYHALSESFRKKEEELKESDKVKDLYHNEKTKLGDELNEEKRNHNKTHQDNQKNIQDIITELEKDEPDLSKVKLLPDFKRLSTSITKAANKQTEKAIKAMEENWGTQIKDIKDNVSNAVLHDLNIVLDDLFSKRENYSDFSGFEAWWESRFYGFDRADTDRAIKNFRALLNKLKTSNEKRIEVKRSEFLKRAGQGNWYAANDTLIFNTLKGIASAVEKRYEVKFENGKLIFTKLPGA